MKLLAVDLEAQRRAILDLVAPTDPSEAFDLLWRLVNCAEAVFARSDDSSGRLSAVFHSATRDLGPLAQAANLDTANLVSRAFQALCSENYGEWEGLIAVLAPQLGTTGLRELRKRVEAWQAEPVATPPEHRYKHAARHLRECAGLAQRLTDFAGFCNHSAYDQAIRSAHGRKVAFWQEVEAFR